MERHRGDRYGNNPDSHQYRNSRAPPHSSDGPMIQHNHRSPTNFPGGFPGVGVGGGGGGNHLRPFDSPPRFIPGGGGVGGFRPMGGGGGGGGDFDSDQPAHLSGQKRGYPFSGRGGGSPERFDGGSFAKLFVGSVPRTATEEDIRPLFEDHGDVMEVALIKDKKTGLQQGCCFIKYATSEEADRAIRALHNQHTLPGGVGPIQVRYADGERERLGAVEYKLFVGSLSKQATEKEIQDIFSPYGRVEDVYLMRDELKQSRGCGFVKFAHRETAMAAIDGLNGRHTMRGCDQPLIVRFADPKRPRSGERAGPTFGGPGFGPRFPAPAIRPIPNLGEPMRHVPPNAWPLMNAQNLETSPNAGMHGFGSHLLPRAGDGAISLPPGGGHPDGLSGSADGSIPGLAVSSSTPQRSFNQSSSQVPPTGQQMTSLQNAHKSPQHLPTSMQLQNQTFSSYSQSQTPHMPHRQLGQPQISQSAGHTPFMQMFPSPQLLGLGAQLPVSQSQGQQNAATKQQAHLSANMQSHALSASANQNQLTAPVQQPLLQPLHQSPSQLAQMMSQQTQTLQASFQSSQQAFSQLQQQLQMMQPSNQSLMPHQSSQAAKQQSSWDGIGRQTVATTAANAAVTDVPPVTSAAPAVSVVNQAVAPVKCDWSEHTSPDGYKYYYNVTSGESKWEKPEELTLFEQQQQLQQQQPQQQQQQQQKPAVQQPQMQSNPIGLVMQQVPQTQIQLQSQQQAAFRHPQQMQQALTSPYQPSGVTGHQNVQESAYPHQATAGSVNDFTRFPQGPQGTQEWMWKNKPTGT